MNLKESNKHILVLMLISFLLVSICTFNILYVMFTKQHLYSGVNLIEYNENKNANSGVNILRGKRGTIYDRDGEAIAQDVVRYTLFAYLDETRTVKYTNKEGKDITEYYYVRDFEKTANVLSKYIDLSSEEIKTILQNAKDAGLVQTEFGIAGSGKSFAAKMEIFHVYLGTDDDIIICDPEAEYAGMAQAAAAAIDGMGWSDIVGSIAGDDTILVVIRSSERAVDFIARFKETLGNDL